MSDSTNQALDRTPPHAIEAEMAVLGAALMDPMALDTTLASMTADDFFKGSHRMVFEACKAIQANNKPVDLITIQDYLNVHHQLEAVGGPVALAGFSEMVASATNVESYIKLVTSKSQLRRIISVAKLTELDAYTNQDDAAGVADRAASAMLDASDDRATSRPEPAGDVVVRSMKLVSELGKRKAIDHATGFHGFDNLTHGLDPGSMTVIAGRPGSGKTALCMNIALEFGLAQKRPGAVFSLEMDPEHLMLRMLSSGASVDLENIRAGRLRPDELHHLGEMGKHLYGAPIYFTSPGQLDLDGIRANIRRLAKQKGITWVVIDYLQKVTSGLKRVENRATEVGHIARALKDCFRDLGLRGIVAAQLNRDSEKRVGGETQPKPPRLSDLRESGDIEQEADNVGLLFHPGGEGDPASIGLPTHAQLIVAKQRMGQTGTVDLAWQGRYTRFDNPERGAFSSEGGSSDDQSNKKGRRHFDADQR